MVRSAWAGHPSNRLIGSQSAVIGGRPAIRPGLPGRFPRLLLTAPGGRSPWRRRWRPAKPGFPPPPTRPPSRETARAQSGSSRHPSPRQHSHHQAGHRPTPPAVGAAEPGEDLPAQGAHPPLDESDESHCQQSHRGAGDQCPKPDGGNSHQGRLSVGRWPPTGKQKRVEFWVE